MRIGSFICSLVLMAALPLRAAAPIPADRLIKATIVDTLSAPIADPMHMPTDVAVDSDGVVYVADGANDRLVRFDAKHRFDRAITAIGAEPLQRPVGLTIDAEHKLWVADTGNHRLVVAHRDGKLAQIIALPGTAERQFDVTDVAVTPDGQRSYIVDNENHRLAIRQNSTGEIKFVGRFGEAIGQFRWPFMVCIATDGYVYTSEAIGARVQRLTSDDRWGGQVGRWGVELGQLYRPKGVVISPRGDLLVSDSSVGVVQIFGPRGAVLGVLGGDDGKPLRFAHPMGMAFDAQGRLYVVELKADRVAIVSLPAEWTDIPASAPAGVKK